MTTTFPSTGTLIWVARGAMLFIALIVVAIGVASGSGVALVITAVLAVALLLAFVATFRNAYVIDGARVGHRNGLTGAVRHWVDAGDIALTTANYDHPGGSGVGAPTLVYWTRNGGSSGLSAAFTRMTLSADDKDAIERASVNGELRPFAVPISTLGPDAKQAFERFSPPRRH